MIRIEPAVRALIFDCDGTLADTMPMHFDAWRETFVELGIEFPYTLLDEMRGVPGRLILERFNAEYGHAVDAVRFNALKQRRVQDKLLQARPIDPVVAIAHDYHGRLPMAVASGGIRVNVESALEAIGLSGHFSVIITADDPVKPKPDPEIFLEAARRLGVEPCYCQVFEDGEPGLEAARSAGMVAVDVRPFWEV